MASKHNHIDKALSNEAFLPVIARHDGHYDWYITTVFYASVHWIRAYLASGGLGAGDRDEIGYEDFPSKLREVYKMSHGRSQQDAIEDVITEFGNLKKLARRSRYSCMSQGWYSRQTGDAEAYLTAICQFLQAEGIDTSVRNPYP